MLKTKDKEQILKNTQEKKKCHEQIIVKIMTDCFSEKKGNQKQMDDFYKVLK